MNIFILDTNPAKAAHYHNDKHCVKMILESAQLLSTAHHIIGCHARMARQILRPTHINHPCAVWTRTSCGNYAWLYQLFTDLLDEYTDRYEKEHQYERLVEVLEMPPYRIKQARRTPFVQCMPEEYKQRDPVQAYRSYYFGDKQRMAVWKYPATVPQWWLDKEKEARNVVAV